MITTGICHRWRVGAQQDHLPDRPRPSTASAHATPCRPNWPTLGALPSPDSQHPVNSPAAARAKPSTCGERHGIGSTLRRLHQLPPYRAVSSRRDYRRLWKRTGCRRRWWQRAHSPGV